LHHGQQVLQFAAPLVVHAAARAHAAEVEAQRRPARLHEGTRERLHHLVVHGAAEQRMRMRDHGHATRRDTGGHAVWHIARHFDRARRAGQQQAFGVGVHR
jgi:hypothetical protein